MSMSQLIDAAILGVVEGLTEFLPVSSTGHLILANDLLGFNGPKAIVFDIVIQCGAILAVVWEYRRRFIDLAQGVATDKVQQRFALNLLIAFLPLAALGLIFKKPLETYLFKPVPVALAFIIGGLIILWVERRERVPRVDNVDDMTAMDAVKLGLAQAFALIPGTSRSGATIIGGMIFGLSRKTATEFSFFLAVPTLFAASFYKLYKERALLSADDWPMFAVGLSVSFVSAMIAIRAFVKFVSTHSFRVFAWYRIAFGAIVLLTAHLGWVEWHAH